MTYNLGSWGKFDRKIKVTGEVFLEVSHTQENDKFTVNEGDLLQVDVLGTEFSYKNRINNQEVALKSGVVKVGSPGMTSGFSILKPGEMAILDRTKLELEIKSFDNPESFFAWKHRKIILDQMDLNELLIKLNEFYDLPISLETVPDSDNKVSGTFPLTEKPSELLKNIEHLFEVKLTTN